MASQDDERSSFVKKQEPRAELTGLARDRRVAANNLRQFDRMIELIDEELKSHYFKLQSWMILELNRLATDGLMDNPGTFRQVEMGITKSKHEPPKWQTVPKHVDAMCDYVNGNWDKSAVHLASYIMWRLNWIHPFTDGNGRTARALSYLVLSRRMGGRLPGKSTIPERIAANKQPYYRALEAADANAKTDDGDVDLSEMQTFLSKLVADQVQEAAQEESPRGTIERNTTAKPGRRSPFFQQHRAAILVALIGAAASAIIGAIITVSCSYLAGPPASSKPVSDHSTGTGGNTSLSDR